ncbi:MAG: RHS repeat-associated core domain-containing protein, partial [Pedobacter sp.]
MKNIYLIVVGLILSSALLAQTPTTTQNYIMETVLRDSGKTTTASLVGLSVAQANRMIHYKDGLGRPLQTVNWQASPTLKDIVQPYVYDALGRETKKLLPYAEQTSDNGSYKSSWQTNQANYYSSGSSWDANIAKTPYPFSQSVIEPSPLNRVVDQGFAGAVWQPFNGAISGSGHTQKTNYGSNVTNEVRLWTVSTTSASSSGFYPAHTLYKTVQKDENWVSGKTGTQETFMDQFERVILKRAWLDESNSADTYYLYDYAGQLRYVLPPGFTLTSFTESDTQFIELAYAYHYDTKQRLIEKKIPGKAWEHLVYNRLDRLVLTQDGNQRNNNQWTYYKYDALDRIVLKGTYSSSSNRSTLQSTLSSSSLPMWEERNNSTTTGYTNNAFPTSNILNTLIAQFYDNYDVLGLASSYAPVGAVTAKP